VSFSGGPAFYESRWALGHADSGAVLDKNYEAPEDGTCDALAIVLSKSYVLGFLGTPLAIVLGGFAAEHLLESNDALGLAAAAAAANPAMYAAHLATGGSAAFLSKLRAPATASHPVVAAALAASAAVLLRH